MLKFLLLASMPDFERESTLRTILIEAAKSGDRIRFYSHGMTILAEGFVDYVGDGVVGIRHHKEEKADEFVLTQCLIKVQVLGEYKHY
jgi:hypothetical protein